MLSAKFSAKQICQNLGVTRETLRHYEQVGLLHPDINPDNGYRVYGFWDILSLIDILRYRSMELSLSEIKDILYNLDFPEIVCLLENHVEDYTSAILKYKLLLKKAQRDMPYLRRAMDHIGEVHEADLPDFCFIPYMTNHSDEYDLARQIAYNNPSLFTPGLLINGHNHGLECYGFITEKTIADLLKIDKGIIIKEAHVACQIIDIKGRLPVDENVVLDFKTQISKMYSREFNIFYGALILRFFDKDKIYHQYYLVFSPLGC